MNRQSEFMPRLEWMWEERNRTVALLISAAVILAIAIVDWWTKPYVSLGFLYLFPIMLAAGFLPRWGMALLGLACAVLSALFSLLDMSFIRLAFETLALAGCVSVAAKKGTKMAARWSPAKGAVRSEPFPLLRSVVRNGPEPSRARRCWARRSEPLTARTVLR